MPANGEVSSLEASSIALCTLLSWAVADEPLPALVRRGGGPVVISSVWCLDAVFVWLSAKIANDAITISADHE